MDVVEKTLEYISYKFSKLGEVNLGVHFIATRPAFVVVASTKATASEQYVLMDGTSLNTAGEVLLLPELEVGASEALVAIVDHWKAYASANGYGVSTIPKQNYPVVASKYDYAFNFQAGSSSLGHMASFTNHVLKRLLHDVHMESPAERAHKLMKTVDDHLSDTLRAQKMTQALTLPLFKERCNAIANRAALFQQLTITVTPPTMSTYTHNDLLLTSNTWARRAALTEVLPHDLVVATELIESVPQVSSEFQALESSFKRSLLNVFQGGEKDALAAVLSTITLAPSSDAGETVTVGNIVPDASTSLLIDGVPQPLDDVFDIGTILFGETKSALFSPAFLLSIISNFGANEITFNHMGLMYSLHQLNYFPSGSVAPHVSDLNVGIRGLNDEDNSLVSVDGDSTWELMESVSPNGIDAVGVEVFMQDQEVIAALEQAKERVLTEFNHSSITLTKGDLNSLGVASINYTMTKPIAWMLIIPTCEALQLNVYNSTSGPTTVEGIQFSPHAGRPTRFQGHLYPGSIIVTHRSGSVEQMKRQEKLGDTFRRTPLHGEEDICTNTVIRMNGVEHNDAKIAKYNVNSVAENYNAHVVDKPHSAAFEITGVYLITFTSQPFGTSTDHFDHSCFTNFINVVRIESVELVIKFNPGFFENFPHLAVTLDILILNPQIFRQMAGLFGNLLAPENH
tara:strand:- start:118 stop:2166 length:2049 start_codon:yes stop_codon:yes gene_type:complete